MTIAAGFVCNDGVVLCTDSELTGDIKHQGPKLWSSTPDEDFGIALAGAGDIVLIRGAWNAVSHAVRSDMNPTQLRSAVQLAFARFYEELYKRPNYDDLQLAVLIALRQNRKLVLLHNSEATLAEVHRYRCIGSGGEIASYLAETFFISGLDAHYARAFSAYMLQQVKQFSPYCGGESHILTLRPGGEAQRAQPFEIEREAKYFSEILRRVQWVAYSGLVPELPDNGFLQRLGEFDEHAKKLRADYWNGMAYVRDALHGNFSGIVQPPSRPTSPSPPAPARRRKRIRPSRE